jgi:hypothetical protein
MTKTSNARVAGATFLLYIAIGITDLIVTRGSTAGETTAQRLVSVAQHLPQLHAGLILGLATGFIALTLGVALYGLTREEDHELALLALCCRVGEALAVYVPLLANLGLIWLTTSDAATTGDADALAELLFRVKGWNVNLAATFFAVGSTIFCWLLLRGRLIPNALAWLGVIASVLLVIALPLRMVGALSATAAMLIWIPMAAFEIPLGVWLLIKGAAVPSRPNTHNIEEQHVSHH